MAKKKNKAFMLTIKIYCTQYKGLKVNAGHLVKSRDLLT